MTRFFRRQFLEAMLGLAVLAAVKPVRAEEPAERFREGREQAVGKDIVMLHGANAGGWCFDEFCKVFKELGWTCHAPDLIGHGARKADAAKVLLNKGIADYRDEMRAFVKSLAVPPVLLGHSMGAVIAQQLAAEGLASVLILVSPAPRSGILPQTDPEKQLAQDLMAAGPFWTKVLDPVFDLARIYTLNKLPEAEQRSVFDKFGPESGRALFELFFWMFDQTGATVIDTAKLRCPVLCLSGSEDRIVSLATARETADGIKGADFWVIQGHGHMLILEPGAETIARRIADWIPA
ncbi:MAG: alpha/beta hydrolase [Methyloceanibacter sp.]